MLAIRLLFCIGALALNLACLATDLTLTSPDGNIRVVFRPTDSFPCYSVWYKGVPVVDSSPLDLIFKEPGNTPPASFFGRGLLIHPVYREGADSYTLPVGRNSTVSDRYTEYSISITEPRNRHRRLILVIRAYNDGVAFRWVFPKQPNWNSYQLLAENSGFRLTGDPLLQASFLPGYTTSHEGRYTRLPLSKVKGDTLMDMPVFLELPGHSELPGRGEPTTGSNQQAAAIYMAITEANLTDYAGMYLIKHNGILKSDLSPLPDGDGIRVKAILPHRTPWRVLFVGSRPGAFLESNLLTDLNDPCAIKDLSWLKPGKTDFHWWNGDIVPDTTFSPGINFETNQYYIDFCARNGIAYHTVIGYGGIAWYTNDGVSYSPGPHSDVTRPIPGLDMKKLCDYAASKGVGIRVWVHWQVLYRHLDKAFDQFEKWGLKGMMVDFMDRDDQQMVNIQTEILRKAAAHHLHIQFHGAYKPTGLIRTWPNELTREGTLNYENDKWDNPITPDDDLNVVFTRLLAGATDYHLGGFRAVPPSEYKAQYTRPLVLGTRCHMLAMYVVLESYLPMVCDYPAAYEGQDGFDFIKAVPSTWDETRVPAAIPGNWVAIARRKGDDWYVGTINGPTTSTVSIPLRFLQPGRYEATLYSDAPDAATQPNHLIRSTRIVQSTDTLQAGLAAGGGQAIKLRRLDNAQAASAVRP
ncbi:alpha-glucosidase [Puia dinghuensis]|uniref:Alpha-glucosidase n=2 Tax=Puia dinghuensis TaxID=1792502 RepID=A0A8J2UE45_9BACT|nr:alpha-glucosidase [Puia dinghuensis]